MHEPKPKPNRLPRVILFVGSHRSLASLISSVLVKEGYTVVTASSRKEALEISKEVAEIHLLIKDVSSHGRVGADFASLICTAHLESVLKGGKLDRAGTAERS